jgi:hypothetical protein
MRVKDPVGFNDFIQAIVNELGIDEVNLHWRATLNKNYAGVAYRHTKSVYILKGMSKSETMRVIAHELRHIWQYQTGIFPSYNVWDGKKFDTVVTIKRGKVPEDYSNQPWESDANDYAKEAIKKYKHLVKEIKR